ncbi:MAG: DUF2946 family protein [Burkholderiales bacterium]|nr:DUF2946 family protein [Burkholderiales bacterium]
MDEIVKAAIARWPDVPSVYGWLSLDRRGQWRIKDDRIGNPRVAEFIGRNYEADDTGRWFFQNGPQRVYVRLDYTPLIFVVDDDAASLRLVTHTGTPIGRIRQALLDEVGNLILETDAGVGVVSDRDLAAVAERLVDAGGAPADEAVLAEWEDGAAATAPMLLRHGDDCIPVGTIRSDQVAPRFGFVPDPRPAPGEPDC